jgi:hypothetical protein
MGRSGGLALLLIAPSAIAQAPTDGFGVRVCGIPDVDGDGTDNLVVADAGYGGGTIWTISGLDGHWIRSAAGDEDHAWLGGSFFAMGEEICACVSTRVGPALQYRSGKTLEPNRTSDVVQAERGFYAWVECAGDIDGDSVLDAALCVVPNGNCGCFVQVVSGKTGKGLRRIDVALSRSNRAGAVACLGDLDGDGVRDFALTLDTFPWGEARIDSGKTGKPIR